MTVKDRAIAPGIVVNPGRCGGKPTIEGRRITIEMIGKLLQGQKAMAVEEIADEYDLTTYQVCSANYWWRRLNALPSPSAYV